MAGKVHLLHYPPPPPPEVTAPLAKRSRYFQEEPVCTDVRLHDNPELREQWQKSQTRISPPRPQHSVMPLLALEIIRSPTPENNLPSQSIPSLLEIDTAKETFVTGSEPKCTPTSETVPSLLNMNLMLTCTRVKEIASTFTPESSLQRHRKYHCPICQQPVNRIKSHVVEIHLPYYVNMEAACFGCERNSGTASNLSSHLQANHLDRQGNITPGVSITTAYIEWKYLHLVSSFLWCLVKKLKLSSLARMLAALHNTPEVMPKATSAQWLQWYEMKPTDTERYLMHQFSQFMGVKFPEEIQLIPPNCIAALIHWRPLCAAIQMLPANSHHELPAVITLSDGQGRDVAEIPTIVKPTSEVIDAHMHLDKFMEVTGHNDIYME